jgi:hypothetical protein
MRSTVVALVLLLSTTAHAQQESSVSKQLWLDYDPSVWVSEKVELFGDVGVRTELEDNGWWRLVIRPSVGIPVGAFQLTGGIGNFITFNEIASDRWEIRPFQGISTVWPPWRLRFNHYLRLEERFDFDTETWVAATSLRLRYQLGVSYRFSAIQADRYWSIIGSGEAFLTLTGNQGQQREQVRVTAGIERTLGQERRLHFEIAWQQEQLFFDPSKNVNDIFFRFRFFKAW